MSRTDGLHGNSNSDSDWMEDDGARGGWLVRQSEEGSRERIPPPFSSSSSDAVAITATAIPLSPPPPPSLDQRPIFFQTKRRAALDTRPIWGRRRRRRRRRRRALLFEYKSGDRPGEGRHSQTRLSLAEYIPLQDLPAQNEDLCEYPCFGERNVSSSPP